MENSIWTLDPAHTSVEFQVRHLMITTLIGRFTEVESTITTDDNFENAKFTFSANIDSIHTYDEKRDAHLKSADFFDAEKFPKILFTSTDFKKNSDNKFTLKGDLTIRGVTKPVTLNVDYGGTVKDNWGNAKAGFEIIGKIKRSEFGLMWNDTIEKGGVLVGDEVKMVINIEYKKEHKEST